MLSQKLNLRIEYICIGSVYICVYYITFFLQHQMLSVQPKNIF